MDNRPICRCDGPRHLCGRKPRLDPRQVAYARQLHDEGLSTRQIAARLGCSQRVAWKVVARKAPYSNLP